MGGEEDASAVPTAAVSAEDELMVLPAALVAEIEERTVTLWMPGETGGLRLKRGAYEIYRAFHLPRRVAEVLPEDPARRAKVLDVVRLLAAKGFLVPPEVGIPALAGEPAQPGEPDLFSVLA